MFALSSCKQCVHAVTCCGTGSFSFFSPHISLICFLHAVTCCGTSSFSSSFSLVVVVYVLYVHALHAHALHVYVLYVHAHVHFHLHFHQSLLFAGPLYTPYAIFGHIYYALRTFSQEQKTCRGPSAATAAAWECREGWGGGGGGGSWGRGACEVLGRD